MASTQTLNILPQNSRYIEPLRLNQGEALNTWGVLWALNAEAWRYLGSPDLLPQQGEERKLWRQRLEQSLTPETIQNHVTKMLSAFGMNSVFNDKKQLVAANRPPVQPPQGQPRPPAPPPGSLLKSTQDPSTGTSSASTSFNVLTGDVNPFAGTISAVTSGLSKEDEAKLQKDIQEQKDAQLAALEQEGEFEMADDDGHVATITSDNLKEGQVISSQDLIASAIEWSSIFEYLGYDPALVREETFKAIDGRSTKLIKLLTAYIHMGNNFIAKAQKSRDKKKAEEASAEFARLRIGVRKSELVGNSTLTLSRIAAAHYPALFLLRKELNKVGKLPLSNIPDGVDPVLCDLALAPLAIDGSSQIAYFELMAKALNRAALARKQSNAKEKDEDAVNAMHGFRKLAVKAAGSDPFIIKCSHGQRAWKDQSIGACLQSYGYIYL